VEAVSFAVPHPTLGEDIAAAVVLRPRATANPNDLRRFVAGHIADFKVPRHVLIVRELPKGPTGKVQRIGLPAKLGRTSDLATPRTYIPPRTRLEKMLAGCWAEILQIERVGVHDDFFALGGDSLLVAHAIARVHDVMHFEIEVSRFFEAPTIAELARDIEMLIEAGEAGRSSAGIVRASREDGIPASIAQERLSRLQWALPNIPFFNILYPLRVTSPIDAAVLERSLNEIVRRHEILRTTFAVIDGRCMQVIAPQSTVPLMFDDLQALP